MGFNLNLISLKLYSNTEIYSKDYELNVNPRSPQIKWPLPIKIFQKKTHPHLFCLISSGIEKCMIVCLCRLCLKNSTGGGTFNRNWVDWVKSH